MNAAGIVDHDSATAAEREVGHAHSTNARNNMMAAMRICRIVLHDDLSVARLSNTDHILGVHAHRGDSVRRVGFPDSVLAYLEDVHALKDAISAAAQRTSDEPWTQVFPGGANSDGCLERWVGHPFESWEAKGQAARTGDRSDQSEHYLVSPREWIGPDSDFRIEYMARAEGGDPVDLSLVVGGHISVTDEGLFVQRPDRDGYCFAFGAIHNSSTELQRKLLTIAHSPGHLIEPGRDHHCVAERVGGILRFSVDGSEAYSAVDAMPLMGANHGYVGLYTYGPGHRFWDLKISCRPTCLGGELRKKIERLRLVILEVENGPSDYVEAHYLGDNTFILKDVTEVVEERKRMEADRRHAEKMKAFLSLASAAAHEMNQPLTIILGQVDLLLAGAPQSLPASLHEGLKELRSSSLRLADIVKKIGQIEQYKTKPYVDGSEILDLDASTRSAGSADS